MNQILRRVRRHETEALDVKIEFQNFRRLAREAVQRDGNGLLGKNSFATDLNFRLRAGKIQHAGDEKNRQKKFCAGKSLTLTLSLSLIHISEPTRQAEI